MSEQGTRLIWRLGSIGADGSGTDYVHDVYEPEEKAPTADSKTKIELFKKENGQTVFRSGKEKNKRENWKVVCADGGTDVAKAAVPGYSIGGNYPDGSGEGKIEDIDREKTTKKYWTDWYGSSWGGWLTGMFGGGSGGTKGLVKVQIDGRNGKLKDADGNDTNEYVPGSSQDPLLVEPAQIWRRRLTWGLGWWRTELVPHVGTSKMNEDMVRGGLGSAIEKYAGRAHDEHVTVMELNRAPLTRRIVWSKTKDGSKYEVTDLKVSSDEGKLKTEAEKHKTGGTESTGWTTTNSTIGGSNSTTIKQEKISKKGGSGSNTTEYVIQTEPDEVENRYRVQEGSGEQPQAEIVTVLKKQTDNGGTETVTVEQSKTEWVDSGQYAGGWRPFAVRQIKKTDGKLELKSSIQGKWQRKNSGADLVIEKAGDWISDTNGSESNWINI